MFKDYLTILCRAELDDANVVCVYPYGSRVYGNTHERSDYDYIVVVKKKSREQFSDNQININFYSVDEHQQRLDDHEISALETYFLPEQLKLKELHKFKFKLDLAKLRHSLSKKSSNSWVKCKKKLTIEQDYDLNIGRKSMFHSFRIIDFGIQIAVNGKILNYDSSNSLYSEIMMYSEWFDLFDTYKTRYNELCTEFRKVTFK